MRKAKIVILTILTLCLVGCSETQLTVVSSTTTIYSFSVVSKFNSAANDYVFTIDTINHLIYNEDSMSYGMRVDSLVPSLVQTFVKAVIADTINLYQADSVFIDFRKQQKLTVTSTTGDTASYWIMVNVHKVDPDSFFWRKTFDLGPGLIDKQKTVVTDDDVMYWMIYGAGSIEMASSRDGENWSDESVEGLPVTTDVEHLISCGDEICVLDGRSLYTYDGVSWSKSITKSEISLRHLLFAFKGEKYALGVGNVILKLVGDEWKTAAEMSDGFPIMGECAFVGETHAGRQIAYIACGIDVKGRYLADVWSTENGSHWVKLNAKDSVCSPRAYTSIVQYGDGLLMLGGANRDSIVDDRLLFSKDFGITWQKGDTVYHLDTVNVRSYCIRESASMVKMSDGRVYVVGGRDKSGVMLGDVWRGINYSSVPGFEE